MENEQRLTNDIRVPNKDMEALKTHFSQCFDKNGVFDFEKFRRQLNTSEVQFSTESYGLEWLGKSYARLLASDPATTLLRADEVHNQLPENENSQHLLLKGDNLEVLKHLSNAYYEKIKMIYIDPPYNTGSDGFVYQDDRKFTAAQLAELAGIEPEKAKRILDFTQSRSNSHSAWLTFMYPRLYIAKQLLKDDGVIFVSIDDNEVAQLRLLMDEVFGEENFVATFPWKKRTAKSDVPHGISQDYEWILVFSNTNFNAGIGVERKYYYTEDYPNDGWRISDLTTQRTEEERPNCAFPMINPKNQKVYNYNPLRVWGVSKDSFPDYYSKGKIVFPEDYSFLNISIPAFRVFESEDNAKALKKYGTEEAMKAVSTFLPKEVGMSENGNKEMEALFEQKLFPFPKPTSLLLHLIRTINEKEFYVLDFFAGSGTTGDAVMQLNAEDGGSRRYILVQWAEAIDAKKSKAAYDFVREELGAEPTIFEITKERLKRAAAKLKREKPEYAGDLGFKVFETLPIWEDYEFEADAMNPQQELFDADKLTESDVNALLTTWKTYDGMALTEALVATDLGGYVAYYGNGKLYLMHRGFTTEHLVALLEKVDSDPQFNPTAVIAFGYHFDSKNLRELAENLKHYANKKQIDMDFLTRY